MNDLKIEPLLKVKNFSKHFPIYSQGFGRKQIDVIKAVDNVSFNLNPGETLGLVGESGSGKTTCARTLAGQSYLEPMEKQSIWLS